MTHRATVEIFNPPGGGGCYQSSKLILWPTVNWTVRLGVESVHDPILNCLLSDNCLLLCVGHPLWREDGCVVCSAITHFSTSRRTLNHSLLSSETPQTWRARYLYLYPQKYSRPLIPPGTGFPLHLLLWLAGLQWRCSNPPPTTLSVTVKVLLQPTVSRRVCLGVRRWSGTRDQIFSFFLSLFFDSYRFVDVECPLWQEVRSVILSCCWASPAKSFSSGQTT
jgi:hypothetical protein